MPGLGKKVEVSVRTGSHEETRNDRRACEFGVQLAPGEYFLQEVRRL